MLSLKNVFAGYGGMDVIRNISMEVNDSVSIIGPNGCGKTTLLRAIARILPSRGRIEVLGKPLAHMKRREISLCIAMLSQQPNIYFAYSVFDTVMMGRYLHVKHRLSDSPTKEDRESVIQSLEAVDLLAEKDKDISKLSGGQLQRVFLARILAQEPQIILLDEPTNHLDLKCQIELIAYLKKWEKEGDRVVVGVLHDINLAIRLSKHLIVMKNGEIHANGDADDIIADGILDQVYGVNVAEYMQDSLGIWNVRKN
jgi:iron complex transport system ATP-binding protein